jgi:Reverse transcriptase (RNA-dependent DNA polymerase)
MVDNRHHALVSIIDQWARALDGGESAWAVFVDFTKAFDRVDHTLLLNEMLTLGAPFLLVEWMYYFLKGRHH